MHAPPRYVLYCHTPLPRCMAVRPVFTSSMDAVWLKQANQAVEFLLAIGRRDAVRD